MYHKIADHEREPKKYNIHEVSLQTKESICHDMMSVPRMSQDTVAYYLKRIHEDANNIPLMDPCGADPPAEGQCTCGNRDDPISLENELRFNRGFWLDKPQVDSTLIFQVKKHYDVYNPIRNQKGSQVFCRPDFFSLDYVKELAKAGLLHPDEEDSEEEPDATEPDKCVAMHKDTRPICDPCAEPKVVKPLVVEGPPKDLLDEMRRQGIKLPFTDKIPAGCQCDFYGDHCKPYSIWDTWFRDRLDMLRHHELLKWKKPFRTELLRANYVMYPPVKFMPHEPGKKTFPIYQVSNL